LGPGKKHERVQKHLIIPLLAPPDVQVCNCADGSHIFTINQFEYGDICADALAYVERLDAIDRIETEAGLMKLFCLSFFVFV
jgi:hypothetical protein